MQSFTAAEWKRNVPSLGSTTISNPGAGSGYGGFKSFGANTSPGTTGSNTVSDPAIIEFMNSGADNIQRISQMLKDAGFRVSVTTKYNEKLGNAYLEALGKLFSEADRTGRPDLTLEQYLTENKSAGSGKGRTIAGSVRITTPSDAAALIENVFKSELGRLPTAEEVALYTEKINKKEKKPSAATIGVPKLVNGKVITEYVGGFDRNQFITEQIRKMPEYSEKKTRARNLTIQELTKTAAANGLDLNRDFGNQVSSWAQQIENGTDIETIKNTIRQTAKLGMPANVGSLLDQGVDLDTIYSPYKRVMASILEINPESITLNDPTLRSAIGPDKEMSIYEFQRQLRKDPRWQYTDNARESVSTAALGILRDFGFQG